MKYRKKPVVIDAIQFDGGNYKQIFDWVGQWEPEDDGPGMWSGDDEKTLIIDTLEGEMRANEGGWIIRGIQGEFYPCKSDIFVATYEKV